MKKAKVQRIPLLICIVITVAFCDPSFCAQHNNESEGNKVVYPDVWGVELPVAYENSRYLGVSTVYENKEDGDIVVVDGIFDDGDDHKRLIRYYSFFSGKLLYEYHYISGVENNIKTKKFESKLVKLKRLDWHLIKPTIFPDGNKIFSSRIDSSITHPADAWVESFDKNDKSMSKKVFLIKSERPMNINIRTENDFSLGTDGSTLVHIRSLSFHKIYQLKDNSFILIESDLPYAIRMRSDLTSPYFERNRDFLILDKEYYAKIFREIIDAMIKEPKEIIMLPSGGRQNIWGVKNCYSRLECFDKRLITFFDEEQAKINGDNL